MKKGLRESTRRMIPSDAGFTMIEVMVAVIILSFSLVAVIGAYGGYVSALDRAGEHLMMQRVTQDRLADLDRARLLGADMKKVNAHGQADIGGRTISWDVKTVSSGVQDRKAFDTLLLTVSSSEDRRMTQEVLIAR